MSNTNLQEKVNQIIAEGYQVPISELISNGFKLFNKNMGNFVVFTLVYLAIVGLLNVIPVLGTLGSVFLTPPLAAGFFLAANRTQKEGNAELGLFFKGFDYFKPLVLRSLTFLGIAILLMIPYAILVYDSDFAVWMEAFTSTYDPEMIETFPGFPAWYINLTLLPLIYFSVSYLFADMFILFYGAHFWEAMECSRKLITKKWFSFFFLVLIMGIIIGFSALLCGVGVLFTLPAYSCAIYLAFYTITRMDEEEEDEVMDHLIV
ncbi:MAG: hypothetical protein KDC24_09935 [Saprospiraceae bacterium]|nr:hypothetical protein [Saprospiraceae bacterium]